MKTIPTSYDSHFGEGMKDLGIVPALDDEESEEEEDEASIMLSKSIMEEDEDEASVSSGFRDTKGGSSGSRKHSGDSNSSAKALAREQATALLTGIFGGVVARPGTNVRPSEGLSSEELALAQAVLGGVYHQAVAAGGASAAPTAGKG